MNTYSINIIFQLILLTGSTLFSHFVIGQSFGAHVHGVATLNVAIEGSKVDIELHSPAANIVGFEHKARSSDEIKAVLNAKRILESAHLLFSFSGTKCDLASSDISMGEMIEEKKHESVDNDHTHHQHDHKHDAHAEISSQYHYECENVHSLESLTVRLFEAFSMLEKINVQWLTSSKQGSQSLSSTNNTFWVR